MITEPSQKRPAVFLDRDGTLIEDAGYVRGAASVRLIPGAAEAVRRLNRAGLPVVLVTNQSGIARGLLNRDDFAATQKRLTALLAGAGCRLDGVYMCPHHPDVDGPCDCRKPGSALYQDAAADMSIDLSRSYYVGDRWRDVAVSQSVGGTAIVVLTGEGGRDAPPGILRAGDLAGAVEMIIAGVSAEA